VKSRDFSPDPRTGAKISAFPAPLEDRKLTLRHATFSISVDSSPLALQPWREGGVASGSHFIGDTLAAGNSLPS
jgi:hypothetical protein